jgi:hypothetical protein
VEKTLHPADDLCCGIRPYPVSAMEFVVAENGPEAHGKRQRGEDRSQFLVRQCPACLENITQQHNQVRFQTLDLLQPLPQPFTILPGRDVQIRHRHQNRSVQRWRKTLQGHLVARHRWRTHPL